MLKLFSASYIKWAKKNGYHQRQNKAAKIYFLVKSGIQTISSGNPTTKMLVQESVKMQKEVDNTWEKFLTQMLLLVKSLPDYSGYERCWPWLLIDKLSEEEKAAKNPTPPPTEGENSPGDNNHVKTGDTVTTETVAGLGMVLVLALGVMLKLNKKNQFES